MFELRGSALISIILLASGLDFLLFGYVSSQEFDLRWYDTVLDTNA